MSKKKSRCNEDCFNCIYDDCVYDKGKPHSDNRDRTDYYREYYQKNKERLSKLHKEYYQNNKDRIKMVNKKYYMGRNKKV